jgi:hypothetical protein
MLGAPQGTTGVSEVLGCSEGPRASGLRFQVILGDMGAVKDRLHELVEQIEPSQLEETMRVLESKVVEKPAAGNGAATALPHRHQESEWMRTHREELAKHRGKWVVIEGSRLVAVDEDYCVARDQATARFL